ncbi:hypothetical protein GOBAR_DD00359 [Gossypium barbadense]|nr:hypothetical protein GOBAR_DD00359 [Gossypium barbadense]
MCTERPTKRKKMVLESLYSIVAVVAATYVVLFGFLKKINEWYYVTRLGKKQNTLPPGDMGWPFIGNLWSFFKAFNSQDPDTFVENLIKRYGKTGIYRTHLFGGPGIIVCSPELCRKALADEHVLFGYPSSAKQIAGKKSLYGISTSEHRRLRRIATNPIHGDEALTSHIEDIERIVTTSLEELATMNRPVNFFYEMKKITFKVIAKIVLGSTQDSVISTMVKCYSDLFPGIISVPINFPGFVFYRALKEEQEAVLKRRPSSQKGLTLAEIKQMEYLPKVIDESMRRANFAFTLFRRVETDVNLNGYTIPKGWNVLVWSRAVHMDPDIYTNPKEFSPSRWENPGLKGKNFIPFGGGSRICPGSDLGKLEVSIFLHHFLLNYKLEELNPKAPTITLPLTRPADNCQARIIKLP